MSAAAVVAAHNLSPTKSSADSITVKSEPQSPTKSVLITTGISLESSKNSGMPKDGIKTESSNSPMKSDVAVASTNKNGPMENGSNSNSTGTAVKKNDDSDDDDVPLSHRIAKTSAAPAVVSKKPLNNHATVNNSIQPKSSTKTDDKAPKLKSPEHKDAVKIKQEITTPTKVAKPEAKRPHHSAETPSSSDTKKARLKSDDSSDDDLNLAERAKKLKAEKKPEKVKEEPKSEKKAKKRHSDSEEGEWKPAKIPKKDRDHEKKKHKKDKHREKDKKKSGKSSPEKSPTKKVKGEEETQIWKWWEEKQPGSSDTGRKWKFLEHKGPLFPTPYERLPKNVKFYYDGKTVELQVASEEIMTHYARMLDHDYTSKEIFNKNFMHDWRKSMTSHERELITDLTKCDFREVHAYFKKVSEEKKNLPKEEKDKLKMERKRIIDEYGFATLDGYKQRVGNFTIEPPGLFRGRGDHPKMGKWKRRTQPEDVIINCSKDSKVPTPPEGHKWRKVCHDNTVSWLASWHENIQGGIKYVMLAATSKLKGEKDYEKYETARKLKQHVDRIRRDYRADLKSKVMQERQRAVALYLIDNLALRAGGEKDADESADTVGCCSLRVEHIKLHKEADVDGTKTPYVVDFDFLGKDSIRYQNRVPVEKRVWKNLKIFMENKNPDDDLFDRLSVPILNKYLQSLMPGLTAKVFRTFNASITLQKQLKLLTKEELSGNVAELVLAYNRANRQVALLCNHQRAVPKTHEKTMENIQQKIEEKRDQVNQAKKDLKAAESDHKHQKTQQSKKKLEMAQKKVETLQQQLLGWNVKATDKEENKQIALGTSKLNYLDPRITVQWCRKFNIPLAKVFTKTHREKFQWAIDMVDSEYQDGDGEEFVF